MTMASNYNLQVYNESFWEGWHGLITIRNAIKMKYTLVDRKTNEVGEGRQPEIFW